MPESILRTKSQGRAQHIARTMATLTNRSFLVTPVRNRTMFEVQPSAKSLPKNTVRAYIALASSLVEASKAAAAEEN